MMIALFPNEKKRHSFETAVEICRFLKKHNVKVVAEDEKAAQIDAIPMSRINPHDIQFLIAMGGDGTILRLAQRYHTLRAPLLGINLGHLGFLADIPLSDLYPSLEEFLAGRYLVEERLMIETAGPQPLLALNDIVFHRGPNYSLIELRIYSGSTYVNTFTCDGIIVATPTGSTAYSLAAGGPILAPDLEAFVVTPICPHTISNRPLVLPADREIRIEYLSEYPTLDIRADGLEAPPLGPNQSLILRKASHTFPLITLPKREYFSTLRTKLGWSGKPPL